MPDPRFFETASPISVREAVALGAAELIEGSAAGTLHRVADGGDDDLIGAVVYATTAGALEAVAGKAFGLCLLTEKLRDAAPKGGAVALARSPRLVFARIAARLHKPKPFGERMAAKRLRTASIDDSAWIAADAEIGVGAVIAPNAVIGRGVVIGAGAYVGACASVTHAIVGDGARILAGVRIGQAGFGFEAGPDGLEPVPQLGRVLLGRDVEIGANTTVDRGALGDTVIGDRTKIDNLCQIGHNVRIGKDCVIAGQTGVSGSCVIGDRVMIGGKVGMTDHVRIGDGAQIVAGSGLMHDVPAGEKWGGRPAKPAREWLREIAMLAKLAKK